MSDTDDDLFALADAWATRRLLDLGWRQGRGGWHAPDGSGPWSLDEAVRRAVRQEREGEGP